MRYFAMKEISEQLYIKELCNRLHWAEEKISDYLEGILSQKRLELMSYSVTLEYDKQRVKVFILEKFLENNLQNAWDWTSYNVLVMLDLVDKYGSED